MIYATSTDLGTYLGDEAVIPTDADRMLGRASDLLDACLVSVWYATDASGNPSDATQLAGLNKACCAQVAWWIATGDELGVEAEWQEVELGPAKIKRADVDKSAYGWTRLCPQALDALRVAGISPGRSAIYLR